MFAHFLQQLLIRSDWLEVGRRFCRRPHVNSCTPDQMPENSKNGDSVIIVFIFQFFHFLDANFCFFPIFCVESVLQNSANKFQKIIIIQGGAYAYGPPLQRNCEMVEKFHFDFRNLRKILNQKTCFQHIIRKYAKIFLMETGGTNNDET